MLPEILVFYKKQKLLNRSQRRVMLKAFNEDFLEDLKAETLYPVYPTP
jgi:hypothetical protein